MSSCWRNLTTWILIVQEITWCDGFGPRLVRCLLAALKTKSKPQTQHVIILLYPSSVGFCCCGTFRNMMNHASSTRTIQDQVIRGSSNPIFKVVLAAHFSLAHISQFSCAQRRANHFNYINLYSDNPYEYDLITSEPWNFPIIQNHAP